MQTAPLRLSDKPSIAVLPFTNMSSDVEQEFFADGKKHRRDHDFSVQTVAALGGVTRC
jgi:TolB-like protein